MPADVRGRSLQLLGIVVSVLCLAGVIYWAAHQPAPRFPSDARHWLYLFGAVVLYGLNTAVRAERWHRLLVDDGAFPHRRDSYALTVIGYTGNNVLPARAGDAVRVFLMAPRAATSMRTVIGTLLAERLLDLVVIVVLFVTVGYGVLDNVGNGELEVVAIATVLAVAGAAAAIVIVKRNERLSHLVGPMLTSTRNLLTRDGVPLVSMTFAIWLIETFVWMAVGAAAGFGMSLLEGLYLVALASVFSLIPSGPAYAGTQDAAAIIGIKAIGGSSGLASTYLILLRFVLQVPITVTGLVLLAARYGGIGKLRRARLEEATT
ncbi:MAG: glycosyltransferase 2 family protein [Solirubrobacteraceae bacterium]|nr:glycosyltransferase 2 family protein [Solirubrobacteraceae bacterium]